MKDIIIKNEQFSILLSKLIKKIYSIDRNEKICFGVTVPQCHILEILNQKGSLSMKELSLEMELAISTLTRMVDILVRDHFVKRSQSESDRRKVHVTLTDKGVLLYRRLKECTLKYTSAIFEKISESRKGEIIDTLAILIEAVDNLNSTCCIADNNEKEI